MPNDAKLLYKIKLSGNTTQLVDKQIRQIDGQNDKSIKDFYRIRK